MVQFIFSQKEEFFDCEKNGCVPCFRYGEKSLQ